MTDNERKESISVLRQLLAMCDFVDQYGDSIDADPYFDAVETVIESLNETRWIPVSEKLPGKDKEVLISCEWGVDIGQHDADGWRSEWINHYDDDNVLAWMPLPMPYREDGEA